MLGVATGAVEQQIEAPQTLLPVIWWIERKRDCLRKRYYFERGKQKMLFRIIFQQHDSQKHIERRNTGGVRGPDAPRPIWKFAFLWKTHFLHALKANGRNCGVTFLTETFFWHVQIQLTAPRQSSSSRQYPLDRSERELSRNKSVKIPLHRDIYESIDPRE
jgi:hypothetical protein